MPAKPYLLFFNILKSCFLALALFCGGQLLAQPKLEFNLKKPDQFKERQLGSEKMAAKKFTPVRRFFQNTYTHYNYYFNANDRLKTIVTTIAERKQDDYAELLPFYRYTLKETSADTYLDSVIQSCTAGILLHDLRNDWIDNMYMLLGKAYLLKDHADSASMTFQYINYSYAPKEKDGYDLPIGSNAGDEAYNAFSISTKEKESKTAYLLKQPPSRNEALAWQIRALTEMDNLLDASSMISTLQNDPLFPERLQPLLNEHIAYLFYKLEAWDSAAVHLAASLENEPNRDLRARRWYLAGQMFALADMPEEASDAFAEATNLALDPVMEVYARLNTIRLNKSKDPAMVDANIAKLTEMARKERYRDYADIILYAAALIELERDNVAGAEDFLEQSMETDANTLGQKSRTAYLLGNVRVAQKAFAKASPAYDSVNTLYLKPLEKPVYEVRKPATKQILEAEKIIALYDSLLQVAAMPEPERSDLVKKVARDLRKQRGIKESSVANTGSVGVIAGGGGAVNPDLFGSAASGWYFADGGRRANGFELFRQKWGDRPNADNWRRSSAIRQNAAPTAAGPGVSPGVDVDAAVATETFDSTDISFDNLYSRLPLTPEKEAAVQERKLQALYLKGKTLHESLEEYAEAIPVYEAVLALRDTGNLAKKSLFGLVHCYTMTGQTAKASDARNRLQQGFGSSKEAGQLAKGKTEENIIADEATQAYTRVYDLFLSGRFDAALAAKKEADKRFGTNQWSSQLLYIESVYYIRERQDSLAMFTLDKLVKAYPGTPLSARAALLREYLPKRDSLEQYLTRLQVEREQEEQILNRNITPTVVEKPKDTAPRPSAIQPTIVQPAADSVAPKIVANVKPVEAPYLLNDNAAQIVGIYLKDIDPSYVNEVLYSLNSSGQRNFNGQPVKASKLKVQDGLWLVLLEGGVFANAETAIKYVEYLAPINTKTIIPWLDTGKYRYFIATRENLDKLIAEPKFDLYFELLRQHYPFRF